METLARAANRGSVSTGPYEIDNSLKLEADNTEYLYKTNDAGTNRKTFTVSMWFKRTEISNDYVQLWQGGHFGEATRLGFWGGTPLDAIWVDIGGGTGTTGGSSNSGINKRSISNQVLRDTSAFYHIVLAVDTTQATEANRWRLWLNGEEVTSWSQRQYPVQDYQCALEAGIDMKWGAYNSTYYKMSGYIAECHYLDGVTAVQTDFGEYDSDSGIWKPKAYTGSYGGNGCYLNFDDSASLGADSSGNSNTFTLNNITAADQATDTPTNNFCTLNPLHNYYNEVSRFTVSEGGTKATGNQSNTLWRGIPSSLVASSGKWYFEVEQGNQNSSMMVGVGSAEGQTEWAELTSIAAPSGQAKMMYSANGGIYGYNSSTDAWQYGGGWNANGYIQSFAIDLDNGYMYSRRNDSAWIGSGNPSSGSTGTGGIYIPWYQTNQTVFIVTIANNAANAQVNFGGYTAATPASPATDENGYGTFEYAPPTGYYALCTKNLAEYG